MHHFLFQEVEQFQDFLNKEIEHFLKRFGQKVIAVARQMKSIQKSLQRGGEWQLLIMVGTLCIANCTVK